MLEQSADAELCSSAEARDAGRSTRLLKKLRVKQGRTSEMTPDEQHQVDRREFPRCEAA